MGTTLIAASVIGPSLKEAREQIAELNRTADIIEVRLDKLNLAYRADNEIQEMFHLFGFIKKPIIATFRASEEGGDKKGYTDKERARLLMLSMSAGAKYLDFELGSEKAAIESLIASAHAHGAKVILSAHNFKKTPPLGELVRAVQTAKRLGADIIKNAGQVRYDADNETMIELMRYCRMQKIPFIAIGMGASRTRFRAITEGAFLTFGRGSFGASAAGQPEISKLRTYAKKVARRQKPTLLKNFFLRMHKKVTSLDDKIFAKKTRLPRGRNKK